MIEGWQELGPVAKRPAVVLNIGNLEFVRLELRYCYKSAACEINVTVPADAFTYFSLQGSAFLSDNGNETSLTSFDALGFTISRFQADGVTPDPFTTAPEPASWSLIAAAVGTFTLVARRRRRA